MHANIQADQGSETEYGLQLYYNTESRACTKIILNFLRKGLFKVDNLIKENQTKAKEFNIGSNKIVFEMNEDTTNPEVSKAQQPHLNSSWQILI